MIKNFFKSNLFLLVILLLAGCGTSEKFLHQFDKESVKVESQKFDTGKMWTFEDAPLDYFEKTYNFRPTTNWMNHVRLSSLKFANWCSASFVSEDGLIMTNHHCVDFLIPIVEKENENIRKNGFYAETLADERAVPNLYVEQMILIEDVTAEVTAAIEKGEGDTQKLVYKNQAIDNIEKRYQTKTGLICRVTELYNGGKYSLYGYKRFDDVRFVFIAESEIGFFGGIDDNFTYPRYSLDCSFLRVYENGKPFKANEFFKWSKEGAKIGEPIFVIGNPGTTERLKTVAQLEYLGDYTYKHEAFRFTREVEYLEKIMSERPERADAMKSDLFYTANSQKVFAGYTAALNDARLLARKKDFENKFKNAVNARPELKKLYGHVWDALENIQFEKMKIADKIEAYSLADGSSPVYFSIAEGLLNLADQLNLPEEKRAPGYRKEELGATIENIYPAEIDDVIAIEELALRADIIINNLGADNYLVREMFGIERGYRAARHCLEKSFVTDKDKITALANMGADAISNSKDPFIYFLQETVVELAILNQKMNEINSTEEVLENQLGRALFEIYGVSIPPDATFTKRINDGVMKDYYYNGTKAPVKTTFYGLYDRYNSFDKKFPWSLPEKWINPGKEFDKSTTYNFISTNDIVGGSSGSPVINKDAEVVGLAFDGNIETMPASFLYQDEKNRMVSLASQGILEALQDIYSARRLAAEILNGKVIEEDIDNHSKTEEEKNNQ